ncbi:unnamed protein product, partial [Pylaiella littoralis]
PRSRGVREARPHGAQSSGSAVSTSTDTMTDDEPPQRLTMSLIERCTSGSRSSREAEERASDLLKIEVLRLDWQNIATIQNLDTFTNLRELYLQHNRIDVIEELDTLKSLEFLALGSNRIRRVENLHHLAKLQVLDLSDNMIEDVDMQELPNTLVIFNLASNPCCSDPGLRQRVIFSLPGLMVLDEERVQRSSGLAGVEECEGPDERTCSTRPLQDERQGDKSDAVTLYVTVHSGDESKIVPLCFSPLGNTAQLARCFCADNGLDYDSAKETLVSQMEEAIARRKVHDAYPAEAPESEENNPDHTDLSGANERLGAILHLQKMRARVMEESTISFEKHKKHLLATTRKLVEQKTASAHGRSDALEKGIDKILRDARAELQVRRQRMSADNRDFAAEMRNKVGKVLAERRRESEAARGAGAIVSPPCKD